MIARRESRKRRKIITSTITGNTSVSRVQEVDEHWEPHDQHEVPRGDRQGLQEVRSEEANLSIHWKIGPLPVSVTQCAYLTKYRRVPINEILRTRSFESIREGR